jgi:predicted ArsR family transcriptional regulator
MTTEPDGVDRRLDALAALGDPVRRRLYRHVLDAGEPLTRDEVAARTGLARSTAAYHLEKLAESGLLAVRFERRTARRGPGAGRPAKLYLRPAEPVAVTLPERDYELIARLLAHAVERDPTGDARRALLEAARSAGDDLARAGGGAAPRRTVRDALAAAGYEPQSEDGELWLRNCPFRSVADRYPALVCGASLALVEGVVAVAGNAGQRAVLDPAPERCCVVVRVA